MVINFNQAAAFSSRMEGINTGNVLKTSIVDVETSDPKQAEVKTIFRTL